MTDDLSDEACLEWAIDRYGIVRSEEGLIFWRECRHRAEANLEHDLKVARLDAFAEGYESAMRDVAETRD